ncbi:hypothetical protein OE88DRAFT_907300 [Heliocybe sulcata]|uniref:Uncharacterized protein n=1 Tax=Heliocybe sulcata TaxID=5364 RepID=A0A5C3MNW7_9AGAM|nr:hypothetical protein OE88DRAFT_907300 [Heliocybe sulcata]
MSPVLNVVRLLVPQRHRQHGQIAEQHSMRSIPPRLSLPYAVEHVRGSLYSAVDRPAFGYSDSSCRPRRLDQTSLWLTMVFLQARRVRSLSLHRIWVA